VSILLDALRKSENSQKPVQAPTIHTETYAPRFNYPFRKVLILVLMVVVASLAAWSIWYFYNKPVAAYTPPVTLSPKSSSAQKAPAQVTPSQVTPEQATPGRGTEAQVTQNQSAATGDKTAVATATPDPSVNGDTGRPRTPVESYQQQSDQQQAGTNTVANQKAVATSQDGQVLPGTSPDSRVAPKPEPVAHIPAPIGYWELPDGVRAEVPLIKFSVLVYSDVPADRFVLINGMRMIEGDEIRSGLRLEEIRRDGVIFSYRLYQFLIER